MEKISEYKIDGPDYEKRVADAYHTWRESGGYDLLSAAFIFAVDPDDILSEFGRQEFSFSLLVKAKVHLAIALAILHKAISEAARALGWRPPNG